MFISDERVSILCVCSKSMNVKQMPCSAYHRCWTKMSIRHCSTKRNVSKSSTKTWWHKWVETQLFKIALICVQLCVCAGVCVDVDAFGAETCVGRWRRRHVLFAVFTNVRTVTQWRRHWSMYPGSIDGDANEYQFVLVYLFLFLFLFLLWFWFFDFHLLFIFTA